MALNSLHCAEVPLRNCSLTRPKKESKIYLCRRHLLHVFSGENEDVMCFDLVARFLTFLENSWNLDPPGYIPGIL